MEKNVARGIRNNNPLNIRKSQDVWQGQTDGKDTAFVTFRDRLFGYRAAFIILLNYNRKGINTIHRIINTWAPAADHNNTYQYVQFVTTYTGYPIFTPISFFDKKTMVDMVCAMAQIESGIPDDKAIINSAYDMVVAPLHLPQGGGR